MLSDETHLSVDINLPRPGSSARVIIFFDLGIYSSARDLQSLFG